ncbi:dihydropteroate synthase [Streptomyces xanthophaeus]|nr:dihydropteroate synthase [Streptomyces xanthophaeus]
MREVVERVRGLTPTPRTPQAEPGAASIYQTVPFRQDSAYMAIGERTNANGSKKFRDAMLEARWDDCVEIARDQIREGAHMLDLCIDYVGRDGVADMEELAGRFATASTLPDRPGLHRGRGDPGGPGEARRAAPSSTRSTSRTATDPSRASRRSPSWPRSTAPH